MNGGELRLGASITQLLADRPLSLHAMIIVSVFHIMMMSYSISVSSKYAIHPSNPSDKRADQRIRDGVPHRNKRAKKKVVE